MKKLVALMAVVAAAVAVASAGGSSAAAADSPTVIVPFYGCLFGYGGSVTVPAGSSVVFRAGWGAKTRGLVHDFLNTVSTTAVLDGSPVADPDSLWTTPFVYLGSGWFTFQNYAAGTVAAGQTATLTLDWTVSHPYWDGVTLNPDGSHQVTPGGGSITGGPLTCTVTGA